MPRQKLKIPDGGSGTIVETKSARQTVAAPTKAAPRLANAARNEHFNFGEHIPFLINRVAMIGVRAFSKELARGNLTVPMWRVIAVLREKGALRQIDLSEITAIDQSTLSRLVGTLCRMKLVSRERSKLSTREVTISVTQRGIALAEKFIPIADEFEKLELRGMTDADQAALRRILKLLYSNIRDISTE